MILFIILGVVVLLAVGIIGFLFFLLSKESSNDSPRLSEIQKSSITPYKPKTDKPLEVPAEPGVVASVPSQESLMAQAYAGKEAVWQKKVDELEAELSNISEKAQGQSSDAIRVMEDLKRENEELKKEKENYIQANESLVKAEETVASLRQDQASLQIRLTESQQQAQKLQEEVVAIRQQMTQELLQEKTETAKLVVENQRLQSSLESLSPQVMKDLEDQIHVLKGQLFENQSEMARIKSENERLKAAAVVSVVPEPDPGLQEKINVLEQQISEHKTKTEQMNSELEALKQENFALKNASQDLVSTNHELKGLNEQLTERTEVLQLELTKSRAQMTSFERACENYQNQLKEALQNIENLQNKKSEELSKG